MQEMKYRSQYRITTICIDGYENEILNGRMYNYGPDLAEGISFHSTMDFLKKMEYVMESVQSPQSSTSCRVFQQTQEMDMTEPLQGICKRGRVGTFVVRILFRQHTSWQGVVTWSEGRQEKNFRSALELLVLIDSALAADKTCSDVCF